MVVSSLLGSPGMVRPSEGWHFSYFYLVASLPSDMSKLQPWQNIPEGRKAEKEMGGAPILKSQARLLLYSIGQKLVKWPLQQSIMKTWEIFEQKGENRHWGASSTSPKKIKNKNHIYGHPRMSLGRENEPSVCDYFNIPFPSIPSIKYFLVLIFIWKQSTRCRIPRYGLWGRNQTAAENKADGN